MHLFLRLFKHVLEVVLDACRHLGVVLLRVSFSAWLGKLKDQTQVWDPLLTHAHAFDTL